MWPTLSRIVDDLDAGIRDLPVLPPPDADPAAVRVLVAQRFDLDRALPLEELIERVAALLRTHIVHVTHPRYFGLFNPSVRPAGVAADTLAAAFNLQLAVWSHAPAAVELERVTLDRLARALGLPVPGTLAQFTSGGAEANLSAVLTAMAHRFPAACEGGVAALPRRPALYLGAESHHSFVKIARMAGLGTDAVRELPVAADWRLDAGAVERRIEADRAEGWEPLLVVATAGTTSAGMVDPLPALREVAARQGAWFHIDAAWGGAAVLSPALREALAGVEAADSVTWDAHKWLSVPMGAGMFFCRHPEAVRRAFSTQTAYMPAASGGGTDDPYAVTPQWSRRAIGLKVFMTLAELGMDGMARLIEHQAAMGRLLRDRLLATGWEVVNDTPLPVVCVTLAEARAGRLSLEAVVEETRRRRKVWVSITRLGGTLPVIRACITSWRTEPGDVEVLVEELARAREALA